MPVTIKTASLKYKDPSTGDYKTVDAISDGTTDERIAAIESAADDAEDAIEAKGAATLETIPSDYTTLSNDVDDLKSAISELKNELDTGRTHLPGKFQLGELNKYSQITASTTHFCSSTKAYFEKETSYVKHGTYYIKVFFFSSASSTVSGTQVDYTANGATVTIPANSYVRFDFFNLGSSFTADDAGIEAILSTLYSETIIEGRLDDLEAYVPDITANTTNIGIEEIYNGTIDYSAQGYSRYVSDILYDSYGKYVVFELINNTGESLIAQYLIEGSNTVYYWEIGYNNVKALSDNLYIAFPSVSNANVSMVRFYFNPADEPQGQLTVAIYKNISRRTGYNEYLTQVNTNRILTNANNIASEVVNRGNADAALKEELEQLIESTSATIPDNSITLSMLTESLREYIGSGGSVTNNVDEVDLTTVNGLITFKNRPSGVNKHAYVRVRADDFDLSEDIVLDYNTIYSIQYAHDLNGYSITIPQGTILCFDGGSFSNGDLVGAGGAICGAPYQCFSSISFSGSFDNEFLVEWFGAVVSTSTDSSTAINNAIQSGVYNLVGHGDVYTVNNAIVLDKDNMSLHFDGDINVATDGTAGFVIRAQYVSLEVREIYYVSPLNTDDDTAQDFALLSASAGIRLERLAYHCRINVKKISKFYRGIDFHPTPTTSAGRAGIQYNTIHFETIVCKECLSFDMSETASAKWISECRLYGGRLGMNTPEYQLAQMKGIVGHSTTGNMAENEFHSIGFEGLANAIYGTDGWYGNIFFNVRVVESIYNTPYIPFDGTAQFNKFVVKGKLDNGDNQHLPYSTTISSNSNAGLNIIEDFENVYYTDGATIVKKTKISMLET